MSDNKHSAPEPSAHQLSGSSDATVDVDSDSELMLEHLGTDSFTEDQEELDSRGHLQVMSDHPGLQRILLPENATSGDAIKVLSKSIPTNEYGLPAFFYRSDLLPFPLNQLTAEGADSAVVSLSYDEGYPTYDGKIWWFQLPHEPLQEFLLFQRYLDQAEAVGLRQLQLLSMENQVSFDKVQALFFEYFWAPRARAYDLFNIAAERKRREIKARKVEKSHFDMAEDLMQPLRDKLSNPEFLDKVEPGEAVEILRKLVMIQRISLGLAANGNAGKEVVNPDGAMAPAQLMRQITEGTGIQDDGLGLSGNLQALLADPSFAFEAQKLVIRVRHAGGEAESQASRALGDI